MTYNKNRLKLEIENLARPLRVAAEIGSTTRGMMTLSRLQARRILRAYPRERVPDWVEALANGDPDHPADLLAEVLAKMDAGQSPPTLPNESENLADTFLGRPVPNPKGIA
jgi:hypothetical protein